MTRTRPARARSRAPAATSPGSLDGARRAALPEFVEPELATLVAEAPPGEGWVHEIKFDGYRMICRLQGGRARFWSRNRKDWTAKFPGLAREAAKLAPRAALLDGEVVALDARGHTSFTALKLAWREARQERLTFYVFDALHLDGWDLRRVALVERKAALEAALAGAPESVRYSDHAGGEAKPFWRAACRAGLEGIVCKRADSRYVSGRGTDWLKVKCLLRQEFVIAGFTPPSKTGKHLGSLVLGVHDSKGALRYAGRVGTGFSVEDRRKLRRMLEALERRTPPFDPPPREPDLRDAHWAEPKLVGEVAFTEWTSDGRLRHPSFQGLREDKPASEVVRERPRSLRSVRAKGAKGAKKP
jgi:bifunctional non-homologous end joining protein LigD